MIEFHNELERKEWHQVVKAVLKGGSRDGKAAVAVADYVLEQDRARISKSMEQAREEHKRELEEHKRQRL